MAALQCKPQHDSLCALVGDSQLFQYANKVNLDLAEADLPQPSALRDQDSQTQQDQQTAQLNSDLARLPLRDPEAIHPTGHVHNNPGGIGDEDDEAARSALLDAISNLKLPDPERYVRAILAADGLVCLTFHVLQS